jgi:hypothetical protein
MPVAYGCETWITSDGRRLPIYGVEAWGGDLVEAYIPSTSGATFQINMRTRWTARYKNELGADCYINGACKYFPSRGPSCNLTN